jgi:Lrp/AsnC family transcriptional regulator, regulator for asnA, asnC and gidA
MDDIDRKIIDLLMEDGRMPSVEIARRIGSITERVVRYRLEKLINNGIIQISAIVNPKALGYDVVADVLIEVEPRCISEVAQKLSHYSCVSYVAYSIGKTDVSAQVIARDTDVVYKFVTEVIGRITGVRKTTTSIVPKVIKDVYQWHVPNDGDLCLDGGTE